MLAHEIKNPLAGIRGAAQLIEPTLSGEDRPLARLICEETDRIRDLVDRMEVFSDERPPEREPVNIHAVLERVKTLAIAGMVQPIAIREDYDPSLPPLCGQGPATVTLTYSSQDFSLHAVDSRGVTGVNPFDRGGVAVFTYDGDFMCHTAQSVAFSFKPRTETKDTFALVTATIRTAGQQASGTFAIAIKK